MTRALPWINLLATLGLLGVTFWYARTTRTMANSAHKAAVASEGATRAAERSAEAARDAASVAQSQIKPEFTARQLAAWQTDRHVSCLKLESFGDAVVVQAVRIRRAFSEDPATGDPVIDVLSNVPLSPLNEEMSLPRRLHSGEPLLMTHPDLQELDSRLARVLLDVDYTFTETGTAGGTKLVMFGA